MSEKLAKLLLMLSSEHNGEIVNAAKALGRALKEHGKDWHWLASLVRNGQPATAPPPRAKTRSYNDDDEIDRYSTYVSELHASRSPMRSKDREFVDNMFERFEEFGDGTYLSVKQKQYIFDLHNRWC